MNQSNAGCIFRKADSAGPWLRFISPTLVQGFSDYREPSLHFSQGEWLKMRLACPGHISLHYLQMGWIIALRVVFSVSANAVQKKLLLDRASIPFTWVATYALMILPALAFAFWQIPTLSPSFWINIILGGVIDALGNLAMVAALRTMDLSVFGPLNGLRPLIALIFGWIFLGEQPAAMGYAGIALTVFGTFLLIGRKEVERERVPWAKVWRALFFRAMGLSLGVFGAVFLKRAAGVASAEATVFGWLLSGLACLLLVSPLLWPGELQQGIASFKVNGKWLCLHALFFLAMQWLTIRIFQETLLAYSFVFFQLAMLLQVIAGKVFFQEKDVARRLVAAGVIGCGSVLILWKG